MVSRFMFDVVGQGGPSLHWFSDIRGIGLAQTLVIAAIGAVIGRGLRIPAGASLVPMMTGAILQSSDLMEIELPLWLLAMTYTVLGWYVGLRFTRGVVCDALRALPQIIISILTLIGLCSGSAFLLIRFLRVDPLTAYLATSPGGLDTVAVIANGSTADVSFVMALQTARLLLIVVIGPPLARLVARLAGVRHPLPKKNGGRMS
jgi:membrane AbrB-like protein